MVFKIQRAFLPISGREVRGVGGVFKAVGEVNIQIPCKDLNIIVDFSFLVIKHKLLSLLSLKDVLENELDFSIPKKLIPHGKQTQQLHFVNFFLIHKWKAKGFPYVYFKYQELQHIHCTFGHPTIRSTKKLLK